MKSPCASHVRQQPHMAITMTLFTHHYAELLDDKNRKERRETIMAREPEELVEMRRVLGAQLAAFRQAAALSQGQLALSAAVDRTTVAHIEKGRSRGDERFWQIVDRRCRAEGALLAGFHAWQAARQDHEVRTRQAQLAEARARADALRSARCSTTAEQGDQIFNHETVARAVSATVIELTEGFIAPLAHLACLGSLAGKVTAERRDQVYGQLTTFLRGWADSMYRREVLQLLGWAATTVAAAPAVTGLNIDEQERLVGAVMSPSRVDEQVIDHLMAMHQYCKRQDDVLGSRAVLHTVLAQRDLVRSLLAECPAGHRPHLLSVYSDMSTSVGCYFFELNDFDSARYYGDQALAAARDADNADLYIHALCITDYFALWQGKASERIDSAAAAQDLASKTEDPLMRVRAVVTASMAYAINGQYAACMAGFEQAEADLASAGPVPAESLSYYYNEGFLASLKSESLLRLGKPQEAAASASMGLTLLDKSFPDSYAFCTLHLGNAHLQCGEIEQAARVISNAASLAARTHSARLVKELRATRSQMQPWQDTHAVTMLDERLAAYGLMRTSAT